jgi:hypothetical protein
MAAERLPRGRAVGVNLWSTTDQSGNAEQVTRRTATATQHIPNHDQCAVSGRFSAWTTRRDRHQEKGDESAMIKSAGTKAETC